MINRRHHTSSIYMRWLVPPLAEKEGGNHSFIRKGKKRGLRQISERKKIHSEVRRAFAEDREANNSPSDLCSKIFFFQNQTAKRLLSIK